MPTVLTVMSVFALFVLILITSLSVHLAFSGERDLDAQGAEERPRPPQPTGEHSWILNANPGQS